MKPIHTPGPWHYSGDSLTHRQFDIYAPGSAPQQHICTVNNLSVEKLYTRDAGVALANAALIAAAPALLLALRDLVALDSNQAHADAAGIKHWREGIAVARAALFQALEPVHEHA